MPHKQGEVINNRYRIAKLLGQGGFGAVYRAWDLSLDQAVALKENTETSPEAQRQFEREARILSKLRHPNLPQVTDYFIIPGKGQYLVMDLIEGEDLQDMLDRLGRPIAEADAIRWIIQVCDALAYLHAQNPPVIHRDIKPANIKINPQGKAILVDFGIAKVYQANTDTTLGAQAVTPGFSPQEQYGKGSTDARSDIYSLGATLYAILTLTEPPESVQRTLGTALPAPRTLNPSLSRRVELAILKAMQVAPANRFQNMAEFKAALLAALQPTPQPSPIAASATPAPARPIQPPASPPPQPLPQRKARPSPGRYIMIGTTVLVTLLCVWATVGINNTLSGWNSRRSATRTAQARVVRATSTRRPSTRTPTPTTRRPSATPRPTTAVPTHTPSATRTPVPPSATPSPAPTLVATSSIQATQTIPSDLNTQVSPQDGMLQIQILAGKFSMGAASDLPQVHSDETPEHAVYLDAFWMDQTEVTNAMYTRCVQAGACAAPNNDPYFYDPARQDHPVVRVSWANAQSYCTWAGRRLPSEAEWEKAARSSDRRLYPWGNTEPAGNLLNFCDHNCRDALHNALVNDNYAETAPVGSYPAGASPYNVLDMAGNVWEWVADWYSDSYYTNSPSNNPTGPASGQFRVVRGSNWYSITQDLRLTLRYRYSPNTFLDRLGFRCAQ
ncbi:MAG: bifunctional serine/threonine-protein kinase/formylglycine-generating enzyme family protein [Chloroflexota bacterium]